MKSTKAFTLIELLVVVLIIGILAAVALPQYQKAVEKSRATQALTLIKSVYQAARAHYFASGSYAQSFDELAVDIPWDEVAHSGVTKDARANADWKISLSANTDYNIISILRISGKYAGAGFEIALRHDSSNYPKDVLFCVEGAKSSTLKFEQSRGDYCTKVMKGRYIHQGNPMEYFSLDGTQWSNN